MRRFSALAAAVGLACTGLPAAQLVGAQAAPVRGTATPRLMVVGDSISQGLEGDRTWRYHLSRHLGSAVDFVGPWTGTLRTAKTLPAGYPATPMPTNQQGGYRSSVKAFDRHHYAVWGRTMQRGAETIAGQLRTRAAAGEAPDHLLVTLGYNDLAWGLHHPEALKNQALAFVAAARSVNPEISILMANVPDRTPHQDLVALRGMTLDYALRLAPALAAVSTAQSPVTLVDLYNVYDPKAHSYDGIHPDGVGEYVIARQFGNALAALGVGRPFPTTTAAWTDLAPKAPATVAATTTRTTATVSWSHAFGAAGYYLYFRDVTANSGYLRVPMPIPAETYRVTGLRSKHTYRFVVKTYRGTYVSDLSPRKTVRTT